VLEIFLKNFIFGPKKSEFSSKMPFFQNFRWGEGSFEGKCGGGGGVGCGYFKQSTQKNPKLMYAYKVL